MLGSEHDGEVANAGRFIARMAREAKMPIADFVMQGGAPQIIYRDRIVEKTVYRDRPNRHFDDDDEPQPRPQQRRTFRQGLLGQLAGALIHHRDDLSDWEIEFAEDVVERYYSDRELTPAQKDVIDRILRKVARNQGEAPI